MTETVDGSDEIIFRFRSGIAVDQLVEHLIVWIGEEHRLDVCVVHTHMLHAVFFLVTAGEFMLLDDTREIVVYISTYHKTILSLSVHGLRINVILLLIVLHEPAVVLELLEVRCSLLVDTRIVLTCAFWEINLRLDDMIKTHLVVASLFPRLFRIEDIIRTALHFFHQFFRWTDAFKRFDDCHDADDGYLLTWNFVSPSLKNALICFAAAIPALMFASAV